VIEQKPAVYEPPAEVQDPPTTNVLESVRKRWPTVLATAIVICAVGLPAIWFLVEPLYIVQGTVKIKQTVPSLLTGEPLASEVSNYAWFVNTEAHNLMNNEISLQAVLDDLVPQGLSFFAGKPQNRMDAILGKVFPIMRDKTPREILTKAISDGEISASYLSNTELLAVTMKGYKFDEARKIVDSFLRNYVARSKSESSLADFGTRSALEAQQKELQEQIKRDQDSLRAAAQLSPTTVIDPNQQLVKSTLALLQNELLRLEVQRIKLEGDILVFDPCAQPDVLSEQCLTAQLDYINADPSFKELTTNVVQMERDLIVAQQTQKATYPALQQRQEVLAALKARLQ